MESIPTGISIVGSLYEQKGPIKEVWDAFTEKWLGRKTTLLITGMVGVGKTTLLDCLTGRVFKEDYRLPGRSTKVERRKRMLPADALRDEPKKRIAYAVLPGQVSSVRRSGFARLLTNKAKVSGIIHVVSGGLATVDSIGEIVSLWHNGVQAIEEYRKIQLQRELTDLDETCGELERYMVTTRRPVWMIVAVNKIDLFHETLDDKVAFYTNPHGPFVQRLQLLQNRVGSLYFYWEVVPVCSWLNDFEYHGQVITSKLSQTQFRQYLSAFLIKLGAKL